MEMHFKGQDFVDPPKAINTAPDNNVLQLLLNSSKF